MKKSYFITGACGGLGRTVAADLAKRGDQIFASDIDRKALQGLQQEEAVQPIFLDVTDSGSARTARLLLEESGITLDGIVCAAGVYVGGPLLEVAGEEILRAININVMGAVNVVRELYPLIKTGGRIVLVSSESTRVAVPFTGPYVMSKTALEAYADTLRRELLPAGIQVTVVQPGAIRTPLLETAAQSLRLRPKHQMYEKGLKKAASVLQATSRMGMDPSRVAGVIVRALDSRRPMRRKRIGNDRPRALLSRLPTPLVDALIRGFL